MENIKWLDCKSATGKFIMKMFYANGITAYMKNSTYEGIINHYDLLKICPDVVDVCIYNPQGYPVNQHLNAA